MTKRQVLYLCFLLHKFLITLRKKVLPWFFLNLAMFQEKVWNIEKIWNIAKFRKKSRQKWLSPNFFLSVRFLHGQAYYLCTNWFKSILATTSWNIGTFEYIFHFSLVDVNYVCHNIKSQVNCLFACSSGL